MQRRDFITLVGGAAATVALPARARAQPADRVRLIGSLNILAEDDSESRLRMAAFKQGLQALGWTDGGNVRIEARWAGGDDALLRK
jgi:putative ABC transport system substrate-binding protein